MKSPIIYYGAKGTLAPTIAKYIPFQMDRYIETFFGSGGLFFYSPRWSEVEIINDINGDVVNFFRVLRDKPKKLIDALQLTPHARREQKEAAEIMRVTRSDVTRALYFFIRINQSFNGVRGWNLPHGSKSECQEWKNKCNPDRLYEISRRLLRASFENKPALEILDQHNKKGSFFYHDPPYLSVNSDKDRKSAYRGHDMTPEDHRDFIRLCLRSRAMHIISGYNNPVYDVLTGEGWRKVTIPYKVKSINHNTAKHKNKIETAREEVLWISPNIQFVQNPLF